MVDDLDTVMNEVAPHQKFLEIMFAYTPLHYSFSIIEEKNILRIDWRPFWEEIIKNIYEGEEKSYIAFRFHY